jgi:RimJ/RimL family protein N-acetyltransferase
MIRAAATVDFNFIYALYMHPAVNIYLLYEPMDENSFRPIFNELMSHNQLFVFEDGGQPVGMCKIVPQQYRNAHIAYLGGVAVDPAFAGKGYGTLMMTAIMNFIRDRGFKRIELSTATHNEKAIALYQKLGFQKEGVLQRFTYIASRNEYWDEAVMAYLFESSTI